MYVLHNCLVHRSPLYPQKCDERLSNVLVKSICIFWLNIFQRFSSKVQTLYHGFQVWLLPACPTILSSCLTLHFEFYVPVFLNFLQLLKPPCTLSPWSFSPRFLHLAYFWSPVSSPQLFWPVSFLIVMILVEMPVSSTTFPHLRPSFHLSSLHPCFIPWRLTLFSFLFLPLDWNPLEGNNCVLLGIWGWTPRTQYIFFDSIMTGVWMNFACDILSIYFPSNIVTI